VRANCSGETFWEIISLKSFKVKLKLILGLDVRYKVLDQTGSGSCPFFYLWHWEVEPLGSPYIVLASYRLTNSVGRKCPSPSSSSFIPLAPTCSVGHP
jgi:hypothetical protein